MSLLTLKPEGHDTLLRALGDLSTRISDSRESWPAVAKEAREIIGEQFNSQGGLSGGWEGLTGPYAARKAKTHPGKPIMQREGALRRSLTEAGDPNAVYDDSEPDAVTVGSSLPYAAAQHFGRDDINLVARALLVADDDAAERTGRVLLVELADFARDLGFRVSVSAG